MGINKFSHEEKRILFITAFFPPDNVSGAIRTGHWAKALMQLGFKTDILTARTAKLYPQTSNIDVSNFRNRIFEVDFKLSNFSAHKNTTQSSKGHKLTNTALLLKNLKTHFGLIDLFYFWIFPAYMFFKEYLMQEKYDYIISSHLPTASSIIAFLIKRSSKDSIWIADLRDLWSDNPNIGKLIKIYERLLEKLVLSKADILVTVSEPLCNVLRKRYPSKTILQIENGFDEKEFPGWKKNLLSSNFSINKEKFNFSYTGLLSKDRDPKIFFQAVNRLFSTKENKSKLEVNFYGNNSSLAKESVKNVNADLAKSVYCHDVVDRLSSLRIQREADFLLLFESSKVENIGNLTGKIFEYMASGTPIIAIGVCKNHVVSKVLEKTGTGIGVNTLEELEEILSDILFSNKFKYYDPKISEIEYYTRSNQINRLLKSL